MKIHEFSLRSGLSASTLRYYEKKGFFKPRRQHGIREYEEKDLEYVAFVKRLKDMGMPLKDIKTYADLRYQGEDTAAERLQLLENHRLFLQEQVAEYQRFIQVIEDKMEVYQEHLREHTTSH